MKILSLFRKKEKPSFMISIPEPCSEDWNKMNVVDDMHRHCGACERTLVDFSVMSDDELVIFFKQNSGKVCGRFRKDQTNRSLTQLPKKTSKATWWKAAALLPLTLFSKSAGGQQLPDSLQTKQTPLVVLPDSANKCEPVVVDWGHPPITEPWKWNFGEEVYVMGIPPPPMVTVGYIVTLTVSPFQFVDSTALIPHADSNVGAKASAIAPKKMPDAAQVSGFASGVKPINPKKRMKLRALIIISALFTYADTFSQDTIVVNDDTLVIESAWETFGTPVDLNAPLAPTDTTSENIIPSGKDTSAMPSRDQQICISEPVELSIPETPTVYFTDYAIDLVWGWGSYMWTNWTHNCELLGCPPNSCYKMIIVSDPYKNSIGFSLTDSTPLRNSNEIVLTATHPQEVAPNPREETPEPSQPAPLPKQSWYEAVFTIRSRFRTV